jgi:integrase
VALSGLLGRGQAELAGIERQHINLHDGTIQVFRRKTRQSFKIPIYPTARPIVERRLAAMPPEPNSRLLPHGNCKKGLAASCKRLGMPNFEPRSLRRFFITTALRAGVDVPTVAAWQGHKDGGALILKTYGDEVRLAHSLQMARLLATPSDAQNIILMKGAA